MIQETNTTTGSAVIELVKGDVFTAKCDLLVVPASSEGTMSDMVRKGLLSFGITSVGVQEEGNISLIEARGTTGPQWIAIAASVSSSSSNITSIYAIGRKLGARSSEFKNIACTLLGTGAGNIRPFRALNALREGFLEKAVPGAKLSIYILDEKFYKLLQPQPGTGNGKPGSDGYAQYRISDTDEVDGVLGVKELAKDVVEILRNMRTGDKGKMFGIFGRWGRGKTYLLGEIEKNANATDPDYFTFIDFHAWKYQDTPASWAYLYEVFAEKYFETGFSWPVADGLLKFRKRFSLNIQRLGIWPIVLFLAGVAASVVTYYYTKDDLWKILTGATIATGGVIAYVYNKYKTTARDIFGKYFNRQSYKALLGVQAEIQAELRKLLTTWIREEDVDNKSIVLVVDDIDRCQEDRIIQIIDALRIMLEDEEISKRVIIVTAIDERMLKRAIYGKYHDLLRKDYTFNQLSREAKQDFCASLAQEYMDKLFLTGIKLGNLTYEDRREVFRNFSKQFRREGEEIPQSQGTAEPNTGNGNAQNENGISPQRGLQQSDLFRLLRLLLIGRTARRMATTYAGNTNNGTGAAVDAEEQKIRREKIRSDFDQIEELLKEFKDATPRQIRIFYYRYLLFRNLLARRMDSLPDRNTENFRLDLMDDLLLHFSLYNRQESISKLRSDISELGEESHSLLVMGRNQDYQTAELLETLGILDMVIAY